VPTVAIEQGQTTYASTFAEPLANPRALLLQTLRKVLDFVIDLLLRRRDALAAGDLLEHELRTQPALCKRRKL